MGPIEDIAEAYRQQIVTIRYRNHRGEVADRRITPRDIYFGHTEWHSKEQWLLNAFDHGKWSERTFAMSYILEWKSATLEVDHAAAERQEEVHRESPNPIESGRGASVRRES